ncbi:MAG: glycosyltransferase family 9 protein [Gemmatimonas sp.]
MLINRDCREFRSDRPCVPHKLTGQLCENCAQYAPQKENILILKFDAMGDVMRSTAILHGIRAKYPNARITWYTKANCKDIFTGNRAVDEVLLLEDAWSAWILRAQSFDIVYSLDPSAASASIAVGVNAKQIVGFKVDALGKTMPATESAKTWYEMGLRDDLKRANQHTYFEHIFAIAGLEHKPNYRPQIVLTESETTAVAEMKAHFGIAPELNVVGINPGAGGRWKYKRWTVDGYVALADRIIERNSARVVLLGGPEDQEMIDEISSRVANKSAIIRPGQQSLRKFFLQIAMVDVLVCGDTLALHIATALNKSVVALFGPTSVAEIDLFNQGTKVVGKVPCIGCYLPDCNVRPTCMDTITVDEVEAAVFAGLPPAVQVS